MSEETVFDAAYFDEWEYPDLSVICSGGHDKKASSKAFSSEVQKETVAWIAEVFQEQGTFEIGQGPDGPSIEFHLFNDVYEPAFIKSASLLAAAKDYVRVYDDESILGLSMQLRALADFLEGQVTAPAPQTPAAPSPAS